MMEEKSILLGVFVNKKNARQIKKKLRENYKINYFHLYDLGTENSFKKLLTFVLKENKPDLVNLKEFPEKVIILHKKGLCFYTINALNELIKLTTEYNEGNLNYKGVKIDWSRYQGNLIMLKNKNLTFIKLFSPKNK